jgi:hypothetical protein
MHRQTTAYHPELNGQSKDFIATSSMHYVLACTTTATWAEEIPWVLLGLCAQPREDTVLSPAEAVFGAPIVLPNELQGDEIPVGTILRNLKKSSDAPSFSLPAAERAPS